MTGISDVAREAGVSRTTVSHVFSGKRPVAQATKLRVIEAAQALHYNPDSVARGLAMGRSMTIGLVLPTSEDPAVLNPTWLMVLEGLSSAASAAGYGFLIVPADGARPRTAGGQARARAAFDGIIVLDPVGRNPLIPQLMRAGIPMVTIGRYLGPVRVPWVDADNVEGIRQLLAHLRAGGYQLPALLSVDEEISYIQDIESAFSGALTEQEGVPVIVRSSDLSEIEAYQRAVHLLSGPQQRPDAIIAATDRQATGVLRAAHELGLRIPADIGVAGQGDTVIARSSRPALTSIRIQPRKLGAAAVEMLLELIAGGTASDIMIPVDLAVRGSTQGRSRS
jgi:DNA-binding LacI/PurR family transcriptional regulator